MKQLKDYVAVIKKGIPDTLCDQIVSEYSNSDEWNLTTVGEEKKPNLEVRNVKSIYISNQKGAYRRYLNKQMDAYARDCIQKYYNCDEYLYVEMYSGFDLLKYDPGGFYKEHIDESTTQRRTISCSFSLNDDFEGGGWAFFGGEFELETKKGDVVIFPSNFCFPHRIKPITSGTRYSIITWWI